MNKNIEERVNSGSYEPKIIGFLCNWCSYTGADLAGTARIKYPANLKIVRVMCSGRMEPAMVLKAFAEGADGVLVGGCHPGDCHYMEGNYKALRRAPLLEALLEQFGIDRRRFRLEWISASEGSRLADIVKEMVNEIKQLGPLQIKKENFETDGLVLNPATGKLENPAASTAEGKGGAEVV